MLGGVKPAVASLASRMVAVGGAGKEKKAGHGEGVDGAERVARNADLMERENRAVNSICELRKELASTLDTIKRNLGGVPFQAKCAEKKQRLQSQIATLEQALASFRAKNVRKDSQRKSSKFEF